MGYNSSLASRRKYNLDTTKTLSPFLRDYIIWFNVSSFMIPESVADVIWAWNKKYIERQIDKRTKYSSNDFWEVMIKGSLTKTTQMFMFVRDYIMMSNIEVRTQMRMSFMKQWHRLPQLALVEFFDALETEIIKREFW